MNNQLYLNCSLYSKEIMIPLFDEIPLFKANNIQDDITIYEDAIYSGRIVVWDLQKKISEMVIMLNDTEIGRVDCNQLECKNGIIKGDIEFVHTGNVVQPFLLQCDLVEICLKIVFEDGLLKYLYTSYLLCVSKNDEDTENIENMLKELLQFDDDKINKWIFQRQERVNGQECLLEGAMRGRAYKSVVTYISLVEQIIDCYRNNFSFFKSAPKSSLKTIKEMKNYHDLRKFEQKNFEWLIHNLDQLSVANVRTGIEYESDFYLPHNIMTERKKNNYDIYENRIIVSFLRYLIVDIKKIKEELEKAIIDEELIYSKLQKVSLNGYNAPIITVKRLQIRYVGTIIEKLGNLLYLLNNLFKLYFKCLPCELIKINVFPRKTKIFQEIKPYRIIYDMLIKWIEFGEINLERDKIIFQLKTMDKLFEYYTLQQMLKMLSEEGFCIDKPEIDIIFYEYDVKGGLYVNERNIANTFNLTRTDWKVTLYYQPVVFSDGYQNNLELYRTTMTSKGKYYTPDFILKISNKSSIHYIIMDSKYSNRRNILKYHFKKCMIKYGIETETANNKSDINMVWVIQGRVDGERAFYYHNNSPNARKAGNAKSYGIVSINSKINIRHKLWQEIIKNIVIDKTP